MDHLLVPRTYARTRAHTCCVGDGVCLLSRARPRRFELKSRCLDHGGAGDTGKVISQILEPGSALLMVGATNHSAGNGVSRCSFAHVS